MFQIPFHTHPIIHITKFISLWIHLSVTCTTLHYWSILGSVKTVLGVGSAAVSSTSILQILENVLVYKLEMEALHCAGQHLVGYSFSCIVLPYVCTRRDQL